MALLYIHNHATLGPDIFQAVVVAFDRREEMDDQIAEVDQHPAGRSFAFDTKRE